MWWRFTVLAAIVLVGALALGFIYEGVSNWLSGRAWVMLHCSILNLIGVLGLATAFALASLHARLSRIEEAIRAGRPSGGVAHGIPRDEGGELINQAVNLDREGEWDQAIALYERVLQEPKYREHYEYARYNLKLIREKQRMAKGGEKGTF